MVEERLYLDRNSVPDAIGLWRGLSVEGLGHLTEPWLQLVFILVVSVWLNYQAYRFGSSWKIVWIAVLAAFAAAVLFLGKFIPMLIKGEGMDYTHSTLIVSFAATFGLYMLEFGLVILVFVLFGLLMRRLSQPKRSKVSAGQERALEKRRL